MAMTVTVTGAVQAAAAIRAIPLRISLAAEPLLRLGAALVETQWKSDAPVVSGFYVDHIASAAENGQVGVVASAPYARRLELGFSGADSLGRVYHQPPRHYGLNAAHAVQGQVVTAVAAGIRLALGGGL